MTTNRNTAADDIATQDQLDRPMRDLRISVTDRCNLRCTYCMPKEVFGADHVFLPHAQVLTFEEIERIVRVGVTLGVRKVRLTGGEPLLRRDIEVLVAKLAAIEGIDDLALTTNASLLPQKAQALKDAGLHRVTVSLDSLDEDTFRKINDVNFPVSRVLEGIAAAEAAGLALVKINAVIQRDVNEDDIVRMAQHFRGRNVVLRFIEFMDVGTTNGWKLDQVVPAEEMLSRLRRAIPLVPADPSYEGEVAKRWRYEDGTGEIGIISSVTQPFCSSCNRLRVSADGKIYTCLFAASGFDVRKLMREQPDDAVLHDALATLWGARTDRYSEIRTDATTDKPKVEMSYIGG